MLGIMLLLGIEYYMYELICDVSYCARAVKVRYGAN